MSTQINQYLMWGVSVPDSWTDEWKAKNGGDEDFYDHFEGYCSDSAFNDKIVHKDGIFCLYGGCGTPPLVIGRVLAKSNNYEYLGSDPIKIPILTELEQELIRESVKRVFGIEGEFTHWLVTHYR